MHARKIILTAGAGVSLLGCGGDASEVERTRVERVGIARAESTAVRVAALPATGLWSKEHLIERLVRAGVAPREVADAPAGPAWMGARATVIAAGSPACNARP
jgi:hypothetical protein